MVRDVNKHKVFIIANDYSPLHRDALAMQAGFWNVLVKIVSVWQDFQQDNEIIFTTEDTEGHIDIFFLSQKARRTQRREQRIGMSMDIFIL
ncbi:MAG: hypothetical protein ACP5UA_00180 [Candidatus Hydrogenedens sp.]